MGEAPFVVGPHLSEAPMTSYLSHFLQLSPE